MTHKGNRQVRVGISKGNRHPTLSRFGVRQNRQRRPTLLGHFFAKALVLMCFQRVGLDFGGGHFRF